MARVIHKIKEVTSNIRKKKKEPINISFYFYLCSIITIHIIMDLMNFADSTDYNQNGAMSLLKLKLRTQSDSITNEPLRCNRSVTNSLNRLQSNKQRVISELNRNCCEFKNLIKLGRNRQNILVLTIAFLILQIASINCMATRQEGKSQFNLVRIFHYFF